jgi:hypothetical protein
LANIPSDPTPIETYQQDIQAHEEFACGYRQPPVEPVELGNGTTPLVIDSDSEDEKLELVSLSHASPLTHFPIGY